MAKGLNVAAAKPRPTRHELPQGDRTARRERRMGRLRVLLWAGLMLGSLALVVSRQTAGYEADRRMGEARQTLAVAEAERIDLQNRVQSLQTRARITEAATALGMHVARDDEIVLLPLPAP